MHFYIVAGANGAGKTTVALSIIRGVFGCQNLINPNEIAKGISPLFPEKYSLQAGKEVLIEMAEYVLSRQDFCVETTLASKLYLKKIRQVKKIGYQVSLVFLYLPSSDYAIARVADRVKKGGHNIPMVDVVRRYERGLYNLKHHYKQAVDNLYIYENNEKFSQIYCKIQGKEIVHNKQSYQQILQR